MHPTELHMRQVADTARTHNRRKENMSEARQEIDIYISQGMNRNVAVNFVLNGNQYPIMIKKEVRQIFRYGCHTICCMTGTPFVSEHRKKDFFFC